MTYILYSNRPEPGWYSLIHQQGTDKTLIWQGPSLVLAEDQVLRMIRFFEGLGTSIKLKQAISICHVMLGPMREVGNA